jgi:hypothetical protein
MRAKHSARERRRLKHLWVLRHAFSTFLMTCCTFELAIGRDPSMSLPQNADRCAWFLYMCWGDAVGYSYWTGGAVSNPKLFSPTSEPVHLDVFMKLLQDEYTSKASTMQVNVVAQNDTR